MSGNLCRCSAYGGITVAIAEFMSTAIADSVAGKTVSQTANAPGQAAS